MGAKYFMLSQTAQKKWKVRLYPHILCMFYPVHHEFTQITIVHNLEHGRIS